MSGGGGWGPMYDLLVIGPLMFLIKYYRIMNSAMTRDIPLGRV